MYSTGQWNYKTKVRDGSKIYERMGPVIFFGSKRRT